MYTLAFETIYSVWKTDNKTKHQRNTWCIKDIVLHILVRNIFYFCSAGQLCLVLIRLLLKVDTDAQQNEASAQHLVHKRNSVAFSGKAARIVFFSAFGDLLLVSSTIVSHHTMVHLLLCHIIPWFIYCCFTSYHGY